MQTENYQEALIREREGVLSNLGLKVDALSKSGRVGEEDQAQVSYDEFISLQLNSLEYQKLKLVNEALQRLTDGDFGVCHQCDEAIPPRRLQVLPWAKHCVPCQEEVSRREADERTAREMGFAYNDWDSGE